MKQVSINPFVKLVVFMIHYALSMVIIVEFYLFYLESYNLTSYQWVSRPSSNQKKGRLEEASLYGKVLAVGGENGYHHSINAIEVIICTNGCLQLCWWNLNVFQIFLIMKCYTYLSNAHIFFFIC